jgi:hypothetical protein
MTSDLNSDKGEVGSSRILISAGFRPGWLDEANHKHKQEKNARHRNYAADDKKIPPQSCEQTRHQLQNKHHNQSVAEEPVAGRR